MMRFAPALIAASLAMGLISAVPGVNLGDDFSGAWGSASLIDADGASNEVVRTPLVGANDQSLGTWGGFAPEVAPGGFGLYMNNSTGFGGSPGSGYLTLTASVSSGFLTFGGHPSDETGTYAYTAPFAAIDLTGDARVRFDCTPTGLSIDVSAPADISMRLLLRTPSGGSPPEEWIISQPFNLGSATLTVSPFGPLNWSSAWPGPGNTFALSLQPSVMSWSVFDLSPGDDTDLVPVISGDEIPGTVGAPVVLGGSRLPTVTGFGLYLDTDIVHDPAFEAGPGVSIAGVYIDAIHLLDAVSVPVELSVFEVE